MLDAACLNGSSRTVDGSVKGLGHELIFGLLDSGVLGCIDILQLSNRKFNNDPTGKALISEAER